MKKILFILSIAATITFVSAIYSCSAPCIDEVFLETLDMDFESNSENLGILSGATRNSGDTIRSLTNQFYNTPDFRRTGQIKMPKLPSLITSAYAAGDCPEKVEYTSRMDLEETRFSINIAYDGTALGVGIIPADSNLLSVPAIKSNYLQDFDDNVLLAAGANGPLTILPDFFGPINNQWVTFEFYFEEKDGTEFYDDARVYVDVAQ